MKTIITLKTKKESIEFINNLNVEELKGYVEFLYISKLEITIKGEFTFAYTGLSVWLDNDDFSILRLPVDLIKEMYIKEDK